MPLNPNLKKKNTVPISTVPETSLTSSPQIYDNAPPFVPRFTTPTINDKWWVMKAYGGWSPCIAGRFGKGHQYKSNAPMTLPNCVSYAWGRFAEILGEYPKLCLGNAGTWYNYTADGYERGQQPYLGAVICFAKPGEAGHVAIVEEIPAADSGKDQILDLTMSESGYENDVLMRTNLTPRWYVTHGYTLQGFIYNPNVGGEAGQGYSKKTRLDVFLESAQAHINEDNSWVCKVTGITSNQAWSAAFIVACAKQASSLLNVIIPNTFSCGAIGRIGKLREMGQWFRGPKIGGSISPEPGDILLLRRGNYSISVNEYYADHCGIVIECNGSTITLVAGDCNGKVQQVYYDRNSMMISGLFRPDWSRVDISEPVPASYNKIQGLYTSSVSIQDAAVREVCYMNSQYQPSIISSSIKLSLLNYTGLLGDLYTVFGGALTASDASKTSDESDFVPTLVPGGSAESVTDSALPMSTSEVQRACYNFLLAKGLNSAAVCGILGNIQAESGFNAGAIGDRGTSFGLCQWHNKRGAAMKNVAGDDWATNVTGQLTYLWYELNNGYKASVLSPLLSVKDIEQGAADAADIFVRKFEVPSNPDKASVKRQANAREFFRKVVHQK